MGARNQVGIGLSYRPASAGNLSPAMGARNQGGIGLSYWPASLCSLATQFQTRFQESIPRPIAGLKIPTLATQPGGIGSLESILGIHKSIKIRAQDDWRLSEKGPGHLDIRIRSASPADSGEYECRARSARDSDTAQPVRLNVLNATFIAGGGLHHKVHTYHSVSIPSFELGPPPHPSPASDCVPLRNQMEGLACRGGTT
jgi:hypothetical protein